MANRQERRAPAPRFEVRRASASEAKRARDFLGGTFRDRISWVAAREILQAIADEASGSAEADPKLQARELRTISLDSLVRVERFLARHPKPGPVEVKRIDVDEAVAGERDPEP